MPSYFSSTSSDKPSVITVSFAQDPSGSLGVQLNTLDKGKEHEIFNPAYATVGRLIHGDTVAKKCGVMVGDCIVAVNGEGFRRFVPDYDEDELDDLTTNLDGSLSISYDEGDDEDLHSNGEDGTATDKETIRKLKRRVIPSGIKGGEAYNALLRKIMEVKKAEDADDPLVISLERYGWDSRVNSWSRFLAARDNNVPLAMRMIQEHEAWKLKAFPIDLRKTGIQLVLKSKAISEIDIKDSLKPPTVYVDFGRIMALRGGLASTDDVVNAFVIYNELLLSRSLEPCAPKVSQLIDLSESNVRNTNANVLKEIYQVFEANYPETLDKMIMYPVSRAVVSSSAIM